MSEDDKLVTLGELEAHAKKWFGEEFGTREEMYVDAFLNGRHHESEPYWWEIAARLVNDDLGNLTLATIKRLIGGGIRDGSDLKAVMEFHEEMAHFLAGRLKSFDSFKAKLSAFREILFRVAIEDGGSWAYDVVRGFSLVELAIASRQGLQTYPTSSDYADVLRKVAPRHDGN